MSDTVRSVNDVNKTTEVERTGLDSENPEETPVEKVGNDLLNVSPGGGGRVN